MRHIYTDLVSYEDKSLYPIDAIFALFFWGIIGYDSLPIANNLGFTKNGSLEKKQHHSLKTSSISIPIDQKQTSRAKHKKYGEHRWQ